MKDEAAWSTYYEKMRLYNRDHRLGKPRVPFQHGAHIDSLPREHVEPLLRSMSPCEERKMNATKMNATSRWGFSVKIGGRTKLRICVWATVVAILLLVLYVRTHAGEFQQAQWAMSAPGSPRSAPGTAPSRRGAPTGAPDGPPNLVSGFLSPPPTGSSQLNPQPQLNNDHYR